MVMDLLETEVPGLLVVAAGRSDELLEALDNIDGGPHMQLQKIGMINYVDDLIVASDLVITKAGGADHERGAGPRDADGNR